MSNDSIEISGNIDAFIEEIESGLPAQRYEERHRHDRPPPLAETDFRYVAYGQEPEGLPDIDVPGGDEWE